MSMTDEEDTGSLSLEGEANLTVDGINSILIYQFLSINYR